jgi:hypothetical protein
VETLKGGEVKVENGEWRMNIKKNQSIFFIKIKRADDGSFFSIVYVFFGFELLTQSNLFLL